MNWADYLILALVLISVLVGLMRGFTRELLGLLTWVLAFGVAWFWAPQFEAYLRDFLSEPSIRKIVAYVLLFLGGLLVGSVITAVLSHFIRGSLLASSDRTVGAGLGLVRGVVLVGIFVARRLRARRAARGSRTWGWRSPTTIP